MAEALAVVGLASAIVQFIDAGIKVITRVQEYRSAVGKIPKYQEKLLTQLPLLVNTLERTKRQIDDGQVSEQTAKALIPPVERSFELTARLLETFAKARPLMSDSKRKRIWKAMKSVANDKVPKEIVDELDGLVRYLTLHHATGNFSQVVSPAVPASPRGDERQLDMLDANVVQRTPLHSAVELGQARCFTVKYPREKNFVGREEIMTEIEKRFRGGQHRVAITGIGGVGKSQIAIEYCYRYKATHPEANIFWVHGSNLSGFTAAYQEIARELAIHGMDQPNVDIFQLVSAWFNCEANGPWLIVLDNVDDIETMFGTETSSEAPTKLVNHLPHSSHGAMIMTTRDQRIGERFVRQERPITVLPYGTEDAKQLLQISLRDSNLNDIDALALLEALDYLPLAISQAAAFMRENSVSLRGYLRSLEAGSEETMALLAEPRNDLERGHESQSSVFQTWKVSFESIRRQKPRAAEILSLMAVLDRQVIPSSLLQNDEELNVEFIKAIGILKAFSLISEQTEGASFGMHRLVQLATHIWLDLEGSITEWRTRALAAVHTYCTGMLSKTINSSRPCKTINSVINPQIQAVLAYAFSTESCLVQRASVLNFASVHDRENGDYAASQVKSLEALAIVKNSPAEESPLEMEIQHNLAMTILRSGKYATAEEMLRQVLDAREKILGPNHPDTLLTMDQLVISLSWQAKSIEADAVLQEALSRSNLASELEEFDKLQRMSLMSNVHVKNGQFEVATTMRRQLLDAFQKLLGPDDPDTLWMEFQLSEILFLQGQAEPAERVTRRVLESFRKTMGREHVACLGLLGYLVSIVEFQRSGPEAEALAREAVTLHDKLLGHDHPRSIWSSAALSYNLGRQGKFADAEVINKSILVNIEKVVGADYRFFPHIFLLIGSTLSLQGKYEEAEILYRRALKNSERQVGFDAPSTLNIVHSLAFLLHKRKQYSQAVALRQRAHLGYQKAFGPNSPITTFCAEDFARYCRSHPDWRIRFPARAQRLCAHVALQMGVPLRTNLITRIN